jgi:hypothetical protein
MGGLFEPTSWPRASGGFGVPTGLQAGFGGIAPPNSLLSGLAAVPTVAPATQWIYLRRRFGALLNDMRITDWQRQDAETKQAGIRACLNRHYWNVSSEFTNSMLIGSWGKLTQVRPSHDVDVLFLLPGEVYHRFQQRGGNRQSQLLQEVKAVLSATYGQTTMRGDGQVVMVPFNTMLVEVVPGFRCQDGSIILCNTNDGGSYKTSTGEAEARELDASDVSCNGNTRTLARLMKRWTRERNVPLKSFHLERLAIEFLTTWPYRLCDLFWYDWMVRDFLGYLRGRANGYLFMPGTSEMIALGSDWLSRTETAYAHAVTACDYERDNYEILAGEKWQEIFGSGVPLRVA